MIYPKLFYSRFNMLVLCVHPLQLHLQFTHRLRSGSDLNIQYLALQRKQLCFQRALFSFEFSVFLCCCRLTLQILQLPLQLITDVCEPFEILMRASHAALCFLAPLLVLGYAGGFFYKNA